jgi:Copper transport outer membrane protein, MctB
VFDFRYHALSLIAVFVALSLGLLLGVAIGDRGLVSSAESDLRGSLRSNVVDARAEAADARRELARRKRIEARDFYPIMVDERLAGARIGLIGFGSVSDRVVEHTRDALQNTGGRLVSVSVLGEPLDVPAIESAAKGTGFDKIDDPDVARELGERVGEEFTQGGDLLAKLRPALLRRGSSSGPLDGLEGVVVVHPESKLEGEEAQLAEAFEDGVLTGLDRSGVNVVGVETEKTEPSTIPWFERRRISSVDSIDRLEGRAALVFSLAGEKGAFGMKRTADALLPSVVGRKER